MLVCVGPSHLIQLIKTFPIPGQSARLAEGTLGQASVHHGSGGSQRVPPKSILSPSFGGCNCPGLDREAHDVDPNPCAVPRGAHF